MCNDRLDVSRKITINDIFIILFISVTFYSLKNNCKPLAYFKLTIIQQLQDIIIIIRDSIIFFYNKQYITH